VTKRIGILTGGGDAPGLNAVIRAVVLAAEGRYGWNVIGIREGFDGLMGDLPIIELNTDRVHDLLARGGTILGAANRGSPFMRPVEQPDGSIEHVDVSDEALEAIERLGLDALIVAGGDGTMAIAHRLVKKGAHIVGVPKTIDNDLAETDVTFGFDTAIHTATEALEKLRTTAESHHRAMVMEVMGRNAGWIALTAGLAGGADAILIPEIPFDIQVVCDKIQALRAAGRRYSLIVVAEGAAAHDGAVQYYTEGESESRRRLGGIGYTVGATLADCMDVEVRVTVLGHVQRGGQPTPRDRWLATAFGAEAVHLVADEAWGRMVSLRGSDITYVNMEDAIKMKFVDPDGDMVQVARDIGIVFG
jgi:ATP-dependent phosphofructokinase / diphosphate-dependent phosphofructokinase